MCHGLRVPTLGQHSDGDHVLDLFALPAGPAHGIHLPAQRLGLLFPGQFACVAAVLVFLALASTDLRDRFLGGLGLAQNLRIDVEGPLGVA